MNYHYYYVDHQVVKHTQVTYSTYIVEERAAKLNDDLGGGSITALQLSKHKLVIFQLMYQQMLFHTDGQIFLQSDLFFSGVRPAINAGQSVSRVGGSAQIKAMKKVAGTLRLDLASYRA